MYGINISKRDYLKGVRQVNFIDEKKCVDCYIYENGCACTSREKEPFVTVMGWEEFHELFSRVAFLRLYGEIPMTRERFLFLEKRRRKSEENSMDNCETV